MGTKTTRSFTILRNVASNWVGFGINAAVTLVLTPFVLRELGTARYGVWILTSSIIGYYGLLDLGFRAGVTQFLTRYLAMRDNARASQCLSSAVAVMSGLGALMFVLSVGAAFVAPHVFQVPIDVRSEAFWCILVVGSSSAIQFALQPYTSIFTATQRFDLANAIGVVTRLLTAAGIALALKSGMGLVGVSIATCAASVVDYVVRWRVAAWLVPSIEVSLRHVSTEQLREIGAFGAWNFLISINTFIYQHVPNFLIGTFMPIAAVGHYALANGLIRQIISILNPVPGALYPAAIELHVQGDHERLERLYHDGSRLMLLALMTIGIPSAFWAEDFYRLWIGPKYLSGVPFPSVAILFQILLVSIFTNYSTTIADQILIGAGHVRPVALALICGSALNLTATVLLMPHYGLAGVAMATVLASAVIDTVTMPVLLQRKLGLSITRLIRYAWLRPLATGVCQAAVCAAIRHLGQPTSWPTLAVQGILAGLASCVVVLAIGTAAVERQRYVFKPIRRLWGLPAGATSA